jgi:hypothetical protein
VPIEPRFYAIFDSRVTDFYCWIIQKENSLVLGSAMMSAVMLAASIQNDAGGFMKIYRRKVRRLKYNIALKNLKCHLMDHPMARGLIMKSGILSL